MKQQQITNRDIQLKAEQLVREDIYMNMDIILNDLANAYYSGNKVEFVDFEELEQATYKEEEDEYTDVLQWWAISESLAYYMEKVGGYVVVGTTNGYLWGRPEAGYELPIDLKEVAFYILENK